MSSIKPLSSMNVLTGMEERNNIRFEQNIPNSAPKSQEK